MQWGEGGIPSLLALSLLVPPYDTQKIRWHYSYARHHNYHYIQPTSKYISLSPADFIKLRENWEFKVSAVNVIMSTSTLPQII